MNHPNRKSVNFELFSTLLDNFRCTYSDSTPDAISREELKIRILDAALRVAVLRAYKKFRWPDKFECQVEINAFGGVSNCHGEINGADNAQVAYIEEEVRKISAGALQALGE